MIKVNFKKLENQVKKNSALLDKTLDSLIKGNKDKYIVFHDGVHVVAESFGEGVDLGIEKFGEETGFVVKKASKLLPVLSALVKL